MRLFYLWLIVVSMLIVGDAFAGSFNITTTAAQDAFITRAATAAGVTEAQYIGGIINGEINAIRRRTTAIRKDILLRKFEADTLPPAAKAQLNNLLTTYGEAE